MSAMLPIAIKVFSVPRMMRSARRRHSAKRIVRYHYDGQQGHQILTDTCRLIIQLFGWCTTSSCKRCPLTEKSCCVHRRRSMTSQRKRRHERTRAAITIATAGKINNSSLNFQARQQCLRSKLKPRIRAGLFFEQTSSYNYEAMKGVVSEQTRRKEDDCDDEFKGSPEEASRGTLQAGSARVRWSKGDDRI